MTKLKELYDTYGQSPWLDNLRRDWLANGEMARWIERGVRGVTSNPSIFHKAMTTGDAYDEQFVALIQEGCSVTEAFWAMAITDIKEALSMFAPLYESSGGTDGFVSLELAPDQARDTAASIDAARDLAQRITEPNLLIKVPATKEGIPVIRTLVSEGHSLNITLIFGLTRYQEVIEAYISGLEDRLAKGHDDLSDIKGVASFFVSRVDTEIDRRLEAIGEPEALALRGKAAVAQSKLAYGLYQQAFSGPRWNALVAHGAHVQRPLWASSSTKNPEYSPTLYVDPLIGASSVNTMPEATLEIFEKTGSTAFTVENDVVDSQRIMNELNEIGIDMADVSAVLEDEGVAAFIKAFDELIEALEIKANTIPARS